MGMPQATHFWTPAEVRALPDDGRRYEVVAGELLVTSAPSLPHQDAAGRLLRLLVDYVEPSGVGYASLSPADIEPEPGALVQPDVFVAPLVGGRRPRAWSEIRSLVLAVEIVSPTTARADRTVKRRLNQRTGAAEYWIVDLEARLVERWRPADERPEVLTDTLRWEPVPDARPLVIELPEFFRRVLDEA
jgi:Uma2 family endonuclease